MKNLRQIPRSVWALGFVSMFMDISSEMIHSLLPVFLVSILGVSTAAIGLLEGVAEATVNLVKIFSGALSDRMGRRKPLTVAGYGIAALTKPLFPIATSFGIVSLARVVDRIGKGIRGAPRDALVADLAPRNIRGASYGLRQSLDTVGAFIGPLVAIGLMVAFRGNFRTVFWIAVVPAFVSLALLVLSVHEPNASIKRNNSRSRFHWAELRHFSRKFWIVVAVGAVFTLARFSEAFLILRASGLGLTNEYVPAVLVVMNLAYAASSYPAGYLSDRVDRRLILAVGGILLMIADIVLARATNIAGLVAGISLWGLHMGFSQGMLAAMVADASVSQLRGTAFGLFSLISGVALLFASSIAGVLWSRVGPQATFYAGASFAGLAALMLLLQLRGFRGRGSSSGTAHS